jgi:hypothetical protein
MQFVTYLSPLETGLQYWESWQRSPQSLTKKGFVRQHYMGVIILVPFWGSLLLLAAIHHWIWMEPKVLAWEIQKIQAESTKANQLNTQAERAPSLVSGGSTEPSQEFVKRLDGTLHTGKRWWYIVAAFHYVPLLFFAVSWLAGGKKWKEIQSLQPSKPTFDKLEPPKDDDARGQVYE